MKARPWSFLYTALIGHTWITCSECGSGFGSQEMSAPGNFLELSPGSYASFALNVSIPTKIEDMIIIKEQLNEPKY